jgi:osmoprotectant transport system permease protein
VRKFAVIAVLLIVALSGVPQSTAYAEDEPVVIGSKTFTESVILGELLRQLAASTGADAIHRRELGGTRVLWGALNSGDIDAYPEYTGTISQEIFAGKGITTDAEIRAALSEYGISMTRPLGFNNTYAIGMREDRAEELGITKISDLVEHPELSLAFSNEFMDRGDGWPRLQETYNLPQQDVRGINHDLAYRGLDEGAIDVMDFYATDAEIQYYDLRVLDDDKHLFPVYNAIILYRNDLAARAPQVIAAFRRLEAAIPESTMIAMNARAKLDRVPEGQIAADFLRDNLGVGESSVQQSTFWSRLLKHGLEHLQLTGISLSAAILLSLLLGILAARIPQIGQVVLGLVGIIQTIPSLALLVFMIPLMGIGGPPAIVALFLYSLLPIVRNTHAGLTQIPLSLRESAAALGLPPFARLVRIELPMAAGSILAGIKTAAVINVGTATLGALIGAGGYGQPILTGIRLDDIGLILEGALPAAALALAVQGFFELLERMIVPKGMRLSPDV